MGREGCPVHFARVRHGGGDSCVCVCVCALQRAPRHSRWSRHTARTKNKQNKSFRGGLGADGGLRPASGARSERHVLSFFMRNSAEFSGILQNSPEFSKIPRNSAEFCGIRGNSAQLQSVAYSGVHRSRWRWTRGVLVRVGALVTPADTLVFTEHRSEQNWPTWCLGT